MKKIFLFLGLIFFLTSTSAVAVSQAVNKKTITGSFTAANKPYDGNTSATILTHSLTGVVGTDDVTLTGGTATFSDKNAANGKTVTGTGFTLSGTAAGNYTLGSVATTTANITARALTVTATGVSRAYDGTTAATVTLSDDRVAGDVMTTAYTTATFADKHVGTGKTISVTGITLTGTEAGNYTVNTTASATANITARAITVTAATDSKVRGGSPSARIESPFARLKLALTFVATR